MTKETKIIEAKLKSLDELFRELGRPFAFSDEEMGELLDIGYKAIASIQKAVDKIKANDAEKDR